MTPSDTIPETRGPTGRRRNLLLIVSLLAVGALTFAAVTRGDGSPESGELGPTAVAERRDLATTLEASGNLRRSGEHTVAYAGAVTSDGDSALPQGPGGDGNDGGDSGDGGEAPAALTAHGPSTSPSSTTTSPSSTTTGPSSTTTSPSTTTTSPCAPTTTSTTTTSSTTTSTVPCSTTTTTTSTTTPTTTTTTPAPTTTLPPSSGTSQPDGGGPGEAEGPANGGAPGGDGGPGGIGGPGEVVGPTTDGGLGEAGGPANGGAPGGDGIPSATLTSILDVGETGDRGEVLYTADDQPVVGLIGDLPAWRTLEEGVDDGADVRQLEENLVELGYGADLDVDESFTAATAAAVEDWETDLGRSTPDGTVALGDAVFLTAPGDILGHEATVGDTLQAGAPVITIGSEQRIVVADVDAISAGGWTAGSTVELEWADTTTTAGTVFGIGREVTNGRVELFVSVAAEDIGERLSGAETTATLEDARREDVVAVPVAAIVDDGGSPAVHVDGDDGPDDVVPVEIGLVADGWVEVTAGLDGGEAVRLPG